MDQYNFINLTGDPALYLSPFSAHQIEIWEKVFPTLEHAYQWRKFSDVKIQDKILDAKSPLEAWQIAQNYKDAKDLLRSDFDKDRIMEELFKSKIDQHSDVRKALQDTNGREIIKVHTEDYYWGIGADGTGLNKMGLLLMKLRDNL
jgi:ribA/ribD-fused uncharacterized protein